MFWTSRSNLVMKDWTVQKLQNFLQNPRWRSPTSCFRPEINFWFIDVFYIIFWTPISNLVIFGRTVEKLQHFLVNPWWWLPPSCGKKSSYSDHLSIIGKGVPNFLIVFYCNCIDILYRFLKNPRNVVKILVLALPPPFSPKFRGVKGDPYQPSLVFIKLDEISFLTSHWWLL